MKFLTAIIFVSFFSNLSFANKTPDDIELDLDDTVQYAPVEEPLNSADLEIELENELTTKSIHKGEMKTGKPIQISKEQVKPTNPAPATLKR